MKIIKENSIEFMDKISLEILSRLTNGCLSELHSEQNDNHLFLSKNNEKYYPLQLNLSNLFNQQQQIINRISMNFIKIYMINTYQINAKMDNFCLNLCKKIIEFSYKFDIDLIKTNAAAPLFFDLSDENIEVNIFASLNSKQILILNIINNQSTEIFAIRKASNNSTNKKYSIYECFHFDESMVSIGNIDLLNDNIKKEVKIQNNLFPTKISTKECRIFTINFSPFSIKNLVYNSLNVIEERPDLWLKNNYFSLFYDHENVLFSSKNDNNINKIIDTLPSSMDIYYQFFPFLYSISADSSSYKMIKYNNSTSAAPKKNIFLPINTSVNFELNNAADLSFSNILFKNSLTDSIRYLINETYIFGREGGFLYPFHNILKNLLGIKIKDEYIKQFNMIERAANSKKTKFSKRLFASAGTTKNEYFTVFNVNINNNINNDNNYCHFCSIPLCDCAVLCLHGLPHGGYSLHKKITKSNKNFNNITFINHHWPQLHLNSKYILAAACTKCYSSGGFSTSVFEKNENIHLFSFFPIGSTPSFLNIVSSTLLLLNNDKNIIEYTGQEIESSIYFDLIQYIYETIISSVKSFRPVKQTENTAKIKKKRSKGKKENKESEENDLFEQKEITEDTRSADFTPKVGDKKKVVHKPEWYDRWDRPINTSKFITSAAFPNVRYLLVNHIDCNTPSSCNCNKLFMRDPAAFHKIDEKVFIGKYYYILTK